MASTSAKETGLEETTSVANLDAFEEKLNVLKTKVVVSSEVNQILKDFILSTQEIFLDWVNGSITFSGFDAVVMRTKLLQKLSVDMVYMCVAVGLVRGNNVYRISKTMKSKLAKATFDLAISKAKIKPNAQGDYNAVTLSRMIACFPEVVVRVLTTYELPMAISYDSLKQIHTEFPSAARHQVCACIIPGYLTDEEVDLAMNVIMIQYMMISDTINVKNAGWKAKTLAEKFSASEQFLFNLYNSKVVLADKRNAIADLIGMTKGGALTSVWKAVGIEASKHLIKKYGKCIKS